MASSGIDKGAVVLVSDRVHRWDRELCDVTRVFLWHHKVWLEVASAFLPSQVKTMPASQAELVAPPVPAGEVPRG